MAFLDHDLGNRRASALVTVELRGSEANVFLVDQMNFQRYRSGQQYERYGGHFTRSPVRLSTPRAGRWHCVVDLGGYGGTVRASVTVTD